MLQELLQRLSICFLQEQQDIILPCQWHLKVMGGMQVSNDALKAACPVPFDEGRLWKSEGSQALMMQLQNDFQQMTKAMDCVGCEKCKLWGKLQLLGAVHTTKRRISSIKGRQCILA